MELTIMFNLKFCILLLIFSDIQFILIPTWSPTCSFSLKIANINIYVRHNFKLYVKAEARYLGNWLTCRELFKHLRILPIQSQYILSLFLFIMNNENLFYVNSEIHSINTRQNFQLHQPQANLTLYQKRAYYSGIKFFNNLPPKIRNLSCDVKRFKLELGKYLHLKSFYTLEEYYTSCKS